MFFCFCFAFEKKYWLDQKTSHAMRKCEVWVTSRRNPQQKEIVGTISSIVCLLLYQCFLITNKAEYNQGYAKKNLPAGVV